MNRPTARDELTYVETFARDWARQIEDREAGSSGVPVSTARKSIARRIGIAPGTLENLRKGRVKRVTASVYERLHTAVIRELQREIERCTHEIQIARQAGLDPRGADFSALEAAMAKARKMTREP